MVGLVSCSPFAQQRSSFVLIAIENFTEQDYLCSDTEFLKNEESFALTCDELTRYTHFFAPSDSTQANLAAIMSGKNSEVHGVRHNGPAFLPASIETLAELSIKKGLRTGLFSGGVPLLQKWGINQGFETFNDGFDRKSSLPFRSFKESIKRSFRWMDEEVGSAGFFLSFYVPDLLHREHLNKTDLEDERPINRTSKVQDLHLSIHTLIEGLKKRKKWQNTHFIIFGISGEPVELSSLNSLSSSHFHVPLQIKWAKNLKATFEDKKTHLISFSDLGQWVSALIQYKSVKKIDEMIRRTDHYSIKHEAYKKKWLGLTDSSDFGIRTKQYLIQLGPETKVYDSFIDKKELDPLSRSEATLLAQQLDQSRIRFVWDDDNCITENHPVISELGMTLPICKNLSKMTSVDIDLILNWRQSMMDDQKKNQQISQWVQIAIKKNSKILAGWLADQSLRSKNWSDLFELGKNFKNSSWSLIAQLNLNEPTTKDIKGCLSYFVDDLKAIDDFYKTCQDSQLRKIVEGIKTLKSKKKASPQFWAEISNLIQFRKAKDLNLEMEFINDVNRPFDFNPKISELYFFLPQNREFLKFINSQ